MSPANDLLEAASKIAAILAPIRSTDHPKILRCALEATGQGEDPQDILARLFGAFRASIEQTNRDKEFWLAKLKTHNEIAEAISEYLKELTDHLIALAGTTRQKAEVSVQAIDQQDLTEFIRQSERDPDPVLIHVSTEKRRMSLQELQREIARVESVLDKLRDGRRESMTAFRNFDQKANLRFSQLSSVLKAINDMSSATVRSLA